MQKPDLHLYNCAVRHSVSICSTLAIEYARDTALLLRTCLEGPVARSRNELSASSVPSSLLDNDLNEPSVSGTGAQLKYNHQTAQYRFFGTCGSSLSLEPKSRPWPKRVTRSTLTRTAAFTSRLNSLRGSTRKGWHLNKQCKRPWSLSIKYVILSCQTKKDN